MRQRCEHCARAFPFEPATVRYINQHTLVRVAGTGLNMAYVGHMNREYTLCPFCGRLESQLNAEARDQDFENETNP